MPASDDFKRPPERERLYALLDKILAYQKSLPDARAVELEELRDQGILNPADLEFMTVHAVTYTPYRRTARHAGDMLSLATASGCLSIGPSGPRPVKRVTLLRDFQAIVEHFLQLPVVEKKTWGHMMYLEFSERDGMGVNPQSIMFFLGSPPWQSRLPVIREAAVAQGLTPGQDRKGPEDFQSLSFPAFPDARRTAEAVVVLLRRGGGLDEGAEVSYSASALDELEDEDSVWTGIVGSESSVSDRVVSVETSEDVVLGFSSGVSITPSGIQNKTHLFILMCIQTAMKRPGRLGVHVQAHEILAVAADVARTLFGADAPAVLRSEGIDSSASLGKALFRMIEQGILSATEDDKVSDFDVHGSFDDLFTGS